MVVMKQHLIDDYSLTKALRTKELENADLKKSVILEPHKFSTSSKFVSHNK